MKNLIKIILLSLIIVVSILAYMSTRPPLSPKDNLKFTQVLNDGSSTNFEVEYSRPYKKNRLIFGMKDDEALVPFNEYWRTGANYSTDLTSSESFKFGGVEVNKGSYWLYTIPGENSWQVFLNTESGSFAYFNPNTDKNVANIEVDSYKLDNVVEQFTINFIEKENNLFLTLHWDQTGISIPIN